MSSPLAEELVRAPAGAGGNGRWYGVHTAVVVDNQDPEGLGRVKIALPWSPDPSGGALELWARLATMTAGADRGSFFIPDPDDEVLVCFEAGVPSRPFVVGSLWNGSAAPPERIAAGNDVKCLQTRSGVRLTMRDSAGREELELRTPGGQRLLLKDGPGEVRVEDSNGNSIVMSSSGVTVTASARVTVNASTVEVSAGSVTVNAGMSRFSGVVQADTVIANSVVSASYTPGAGNIW